MFIPRAKGFHPKEPLRFRGLGVPKIRVYLIWGVLIIRILPKPPKVGKIMAQHLQKAIILCTFGVQV